MNSHYLARNQLIQTIPCQHCWACKLNKSAEWATRAMLETQEHDYNYFITLTYDDEHLPIPEYMTYKEQWNLGYKILELENRIENDGTWIDGTLYPEHVKKFIKDLRNYAKRKLGIDGIKYLYCGEYGENKRPHYHMLLFGMPLPMNEASKIHVDKKFFKEHWKSQILQELWPYGMHDIANMEWSDAAYVCRYTMKKIYEEEESDRWYAENGKMKEFIRMSNRPGIGMKYYQRNKFKIYENDSMIMKTVKGNTGSFKPPKAFDKLFKEEYPEEFKKIEKHRKECAERARRNSYRLSDYTDYERLKLKAEKVATKAAMLPRDGLEQ